MPINYPLKEGDYEVIDDVRIDFTNAMGDLDASQIIDPQEFDTTMVVAKQYEEDLIEYPTAGNWFNLDETEGTQNSNKNYWSTNKDVVFYLVQAGTTEGVVWTFIAAPQNITITKNMDYTAEQNWASNQRTITYGGTSMRRISLSEVLIEGLATKANITRKVNNLSKLLDPVQYQKHIAPLVFELIVKPKNGKSQESRSFGNFLITDVGLTEILRNQIGRPLRVVANIELQEIPKYQIHDGRDLTLPDNLVVKVDKTAKDELNDDKTDKPDGSTAGDIKEATTKQTITYRNSDGDLVKGTQYNGTKVIDGVEYEQTWYEDKNGDTISPPTFVNRSGKVEKVQKTQANSTSLKGNYTSNINTAPKEN